MTFLDPLLQWIEKQPAHALLAFGGALLFLFLLNIVTLTLFASLSRRQERLVNGVPGANLGEKIGENAARAPEPDALPKQSDMMSAPSAVSLLSCYSQIGFVRYDALSDAGGKQSFSLALLDGRGNGFVLSSLQLRQDVRVYAKPLRERVSDSPLTDEEQQAVRLAQPGGPASESAPAPAINPPKANAARRETQAR